MQIHAVILLVICACFTTALGRSIGYDDYSDELLDQHYGSWYDSQTEGYDTSYMPLYDAYNVDKDYNTDPDGSGDDISEVTQKPMNLYKLSIVTYIKPLRKVDDAGIDSDEDNKEDQNDDSNESKEDGVTEQSNEATDDDVNNDDDDDDDDDNDDKHSMTLCTLGSLGIECTSNNKLGVYDTVNKMDDDDTSTHTELVNEDDSDEDTEPPQDNDSEIFQPGDYHGNLLRKLASASSNSNILTSEYNQNLKDFQLANVRIQRDLFSLIDQNIFLLNDFSEISSDRSEYNGQQHRKIMKDLTDILNNVDKVRSGVLEMQKLEQRQDYHRLLQQVVREIYADNKLDTIDEI